jgi:hypothetical protein
MPLDVAFCQQDDSRGRVPYVTPFRFELSALHGGRFRVALVREGGPGPP